MLNSFKPVLLLSIVLLLQGCVGAAVVGTGIAGSAITDSRSIGTQIDDHTLYINSLNTLSNDQELWENNRIITSTLNSKILLVGQVTDEETRVKVQRLLQNLDGTSKVLNELKVAPKISLSTQSKDSWITTKIKSKIYADDNIPTGKIKVITENSEVFLIGMVTSAEAERAIDIARYESGVTKVVKVFDII